MNSIDSHNWPIRQLAYEDYPELIKQAGHAPKELYIRGDFPPQEYKFLTVVGSRSMSEYGKLCCKQLIAGLRGYPIVIVSGLAIGIDSVAHTAALEAGLKTIAIPGSGLDDRIIYPEAHFELALRILDQGGCLLSQFDETVSGQKWAFPVRNRTVAAVSHATLVIEGGVKSGSLITSKWATDLNRDVLALPGRITDSKSVGPHQLIRMGATPITCSEDIIEALGFKTQTDRTAIDYSKLTRDELKIVALLSNPLPRETLLEKLAPFGIETPQASVLISTLELHGFIEEKLGELRKI